MARWPARVGQAMVSQARALPDGRATTPPVLVHGGIAGRPTVRFHSGTALLFIDGFANAHLTGAFTLFLVTRSQESTFRARGNAANGGGGSPRLYLMRDSFVYNKRFGSTLPVGAEAGEAAITVYQHDGQDTATNLPERKAERHGVGSRLRSTQGVRVRWQPRHAVLVWQQARRRRCGRDHRPRSPAWRRGACRSGTVPRRPLSVSGRSRLAHDGPKRGPLTARCPMQGAPALASNARARPPRAVRAASREVSPHPRPIGSEVLERLA